MEPVHRQVVALSHSQPQWQDVRGQRVFTSIVRMPHPGPLYFTAGGLENNQTAVHTADVLALPSEHYDYWTTRFALPRSAWDWAHWGENLTVSGLDENALRVGDILHAGPDARFEVTSPRTPCFKLAWRLGQPDSVLREMVRTGYIGFYLRVISPGWVQAGHPIVLQSAPPDAITVGDLARLLFDDAVEDIDRLRRILLTPGLGGQAKGMLQRRISGMRDEQRQRTGQWTGWREFVITERIPQAEGIHSFRLEPADQQPIAPALAGQFLTLRLPLESEPATRCWTISDYQHEPTSYRLTIRRSADASSWMHTTAAPGTRVLARPPMGKFALNRAGFLRVVLISAGVGVTPMISMLQAHLERGAEATPLLWIHCARSGRYSPHREEIRQLLNTGANITRLVYYSQPEPGDDYDRAGRLTAEQLKSIIQNPYTTSLFGREIELGGEHSDFYVCGPPDFEAMVRSSLEGVASLRCESFSNVPASTEQALESAEVFFKRSGVSALWSREGNQTLLELAEQHAIDAPFGCRAGVCQTCATGLLHGEVDYATPPADLLTAGAVLLCCARPATPRIELDL
jgi:ferredoxin-NADP reductase/MOSC domain-containing protein YiiM